MEESNRFIECKRDHIFLTPSFEREEKECKNCNARFLPLHPKTLCCNSYCREQYLNKEKVKKWGESKYHKGNTIDSKQRRKIATKMEIPYEGDPGYMKQFKAVRG